MELPQLRLTTVCIPLALVCGQVLVSQASEESTPVDYVTEVPEATGNLGTMLYEPSEGELPFFEKLAEDEITTGGLAGPYDISKKAGKYVGWFGVVREIDVDKSRGKTVLTVEHKYFDGFTDTHILALSFNGSGDFRTVLDGTVHEIPLLTLVKVYGTVANEPEEGRPRVEAVFVRNWQWGAFTFLHARGKQNGSEKWRQLNSIDLEQIYEPYPFVPYYEQRLGKRDVTPARRRIIESVGPLTPEVEKPLTELAEAVLGGNDALARESLARVRERGGEQHAMKTLLACLGGDVPRVTNVAGWMFDEIGHPAADPLAKALGSGRTRIRTDAAICLVILGNKAEGAVGALTRALEDPCPDVRRWSAVALTDLGEAARPALPQLTKMLGDPDDDARLDSIKAVWSITLEPDPAIKVMSQILTSADDSHDRYGAAEALGEMGAAEGIPALIQALGDEDRYVRAIAAAALGEARLNLDLAIPALMKAMHDEDDYVRANAADSLGQMAPASIDAVPLLIAALDDEDSHVRLVALGALELFGPKAAAAIPELLDMHKNDEETLHRGCVLKTLAVIDQEGKEALPVLMTALEDAEPQMRRFAAESLGMLGRHAEPAVEKLIDRLEDPDKGVRVYAAGALWKIDRRAKLAVPVLIEVLQTGSSFERMWATWHIPEIGPDARAASHALAENLTRSFPQAGAAQALCRMGPLPADVVDALRRAKESEREDVGVWAALALWKIDHDPKQLEYLVDVAAHRSFNEQAHAFRILGEIGPEAKLVVPTLVKLVRHPKIDVRRQAAETLKKIDPSALGSADKP